jgi:hypothetical protein
MRAIVLGVAALALVAVSTPAFAQRHGGDGDRSGNWNRGSNHQDWNGNGHNRRHGGSVPGIGIYLGAPSAYAACPLVRIVRQGRVRWVPSC